MIEWEKQLQKVIAISSILEECVDRKKTYGGEVYEILIDCMFDFCYKDINNVLILK